MTDQHQVPDPTRDLLSRERFERLSDGTQLRRPIPLSEAAGEWRGMVNREGERRVALRLEHSEEGTDVVGMSSTFALIVASLLEELALRTQPGRAVGPLRTDDELSQLTGLVAGMLRAL